MKTCYRPQGKVMFSEAFVCSQVDRVSVVPGTWSHAQAFVSWEYG